MPEGHVVEILLSETATISLNSFISSHVTESPAETTISELLADESQRSPEEDVLFCSEDELIEKILGTLTRREALIIKRRYGLTDSVEHTLAEIGRQLGISRERVRQIETEAVRKLCHQSRTELLKELL